MIAGLLVFVGCVSLAGAGDRPLAEGVGLVMAGLLLAVVPAVIWLLVFYVQDRLEPEPKRYVLGVFSAGRGAGGHGRPTVIDNFFQVNAWSGVSLPVKIAADVLIVGALQAFLIYAAVRYTVFRSDEFDEPVDGIIYGAAAGLGYATMIQHQLYRWSRRR